MVEKKWKCGNEMSSTVCTAFHFISFQKGQFTQHNEVCVRACELQSVMSDRIKIDGFISVAAIVVVFFEPVHTYNVHDGWPRKRAIEKQGQRKISVCARVCVLCATLPLWLSDGSEWEWRLCRRWWLQQKK